MVKIGVFWIHNGTVIGKAESFGGGELRAFQGSLTATKITLMSGKLLIDVQILPVPFKKQHPYLPAKSFILLFL
jgi:hypothetical protein